MDLLMLALIVATTFFAQFYASSVGGASMLTLPVMFLAGMPSNIAVGTNRVYHVFTTALAASKFLKKTKFEMRNLVLYLVTGTAGAVLGAFVAISLDEKMLKSLISAVLLALGVFFLAKKDFGLREHKPEKAGEKNLVVAGIAVFALGLYRSVIGSAGDTFLRIFFVIKERLSFLQAAAYSSVIAFAGNVFATVVFMWSGVIDYWVALPMIVAGILGTYVGVQIAIKGGNELIRKIFLALVIITSLRLIGGVIFGI